MFSFQVTCQGWFQAELNASNAVTVLLLAFNKQTDKHSPDNEKAAMSNKKKTLYKSDENKCPSHKI